MLFYSKLLLAFVYFKMDRSSLPSSLDEPTITDLFSSLLVFDSKYGVIICKPCQYAIVPHELSSHLRTHHREEEGFTFSKIKTVSDYALTLPTCPPAWIKDLYLHPTDTPAIPFLQTYQDSYACSLC